jgi:hypothetical protein
MPITDEQAEKIGKTICDSYYNHKGDHDASSIVSGHAAYAACEALTREQHAREMLAEQTKEEWCEAVGLGIGRWDFHCAIDGKRFAEFDAIKAMLLIRLAKYTAKSDPAVEAVGKVVERLFPQGNYDIRPEIRAQSIREIIAAVDAVRKGEKE